MLRPHRTMKLEVSSFAFSKAFCASSSHWLILPLLGLRCLRLCWLCSNIGTPRAESWREREAEICKLSCLSCLSCLTYPTQRNALGMAFELAAIWANLTMVPFCDWMWLREKKNSCGKDARAGQTSKERKQEAVKRCRCKSLKLEGRHWKGSWWWLIRYPCCTMLFIRAALQSSLQSDTNGHMNTNQTELLTDWIASKTTMVSNGIFSKSARKIRSASASWHNFWMTLCHIVSSIVSSTCHRYPWNSRSIAIPTGRSTFRSSKDEKAAVATAGTNMEQTVWQLEQTGTRHGMYGISGISESICKSIESIYVYLYFASHASPWRLP